MGKQVQFRRTAPATPTRTTSRLYFPVYGRKHDDSRYGLVAAGLNPRHMHCLWELFCCPLGHPRAAVHWHGETGGDWRVWVHRPGRGRWSWSSSLGELWCGTAAVVPPRTVRPGSPGARGSDPEGRLEKPGAPATRETCRRHSSPGPTWPQQISFSLVGQWQMHARM